jgi:hypothetical protein
MNGEDVFGSITHLHEGNRRGEPVECVVVSIVLVLDCRRP